MRPLSKITAALVGIGILATISVGVQPASAAGPNATETVSTSVTADALAQSLVGPGVTVSNVVYTGAADAKGAFSFADPTVVGVASGVILSSGNAHDVVGPNTSDSFSTDWQGAGDTQLDTLSGYPTRDAAVLEFDFVPAANQVSFQYAFASEEYSEWVNTQFNDVFQFAVNGENCATVRQVAGDATSPFVPVAINNINDSNPVQTPAPTAMRPDLFRANDYTGAPSSAIDLEADGITSVMSCQSAVTPGVTNHMRLAIADASDGIYDSNVFIEAGSLVSNENPIADLGVTPKVGAAPLPVTATVEGHDPNGLPLTYTLDFGDGTVLSGVALPDLTDIQPHTYTYGGSYQLTLTVSNGTLSGTDVEDVEVTGPPAPPSDIAPTVTDDPSSQDVLAGSPFSFSAAADGTPAPTVQWEQSTDSGVSWSEVAGATTDSFDGVATNAMNGRQFRAVFSNPGGDATTAAATLTVHPAEVSVSAPGTAVVGSNVTVTATAVVGGVAPSATGGKVSFYDGVKLLTTKTVKAGSASFSTTKFGVGTHTITAVYQQKSTSAQVTSSAVTMTITKASTVTTLAASATTVPKGSSVTFTATVAVVAPGSATVSGKVLFYDGSKLIGTGTVVAGTATFTRAMSKGTHTITAVYNGSGQLLASPASSAVVVIAS